MNKLTLDEAISYFDSQCPNHYSRENKTEWINELDEFVYESVIRERENPEISEFTPYDTDTSGDTELLIPKMFKEAYRYYLEKSVAYSNREIASFNNASRMFQAYFENYFAWYNRNHKSLSTQRFVI